MHRGDDFVERMIEDPTVHLKESAEDFWGYPVPVSPLTKGRSLLAKYAIVRTDMRKLYQPNHDRFYTVAVEVFCDRPGLPRAGTHDEFRGRVRDAAHRGSVFRYQRHLGSAARDGAHANQGGESAPAAGRPRGKGHAE